MATAGKTTALVKGRPVAENTTELFQIARGLADSALCPDQYKGKPKDAFAAIIAGSEVGFQPMQALKTIAVINGRPSIFGDGLPAIAYASGKLKRFSERFEGKPFDEDFQHVIEIERTDVDGVREFRFSVEDAKLAGLWDTRETVTFRNGGTGPNKAPWFLYKKRMIQMRNRAYAFRDCFADYLAGLHVAEEQQDIADHHAPIHVESEQPAFTFSELADDTEPSDETESIYPDEEVIDAESEPVTPAEPEIDTQAIQQVWQADISAADTSNKLNALLDIAKRDCQPGEYPVVEIMIEERRAGLKGSKNRGDDGGLF